MKKSICFLIFGLCLFSITAIAQVGIEIEDNVVLATVNGSPITLFSVLSETAGQEAKLSLSHAGIRLHEERLKLRKQAIDDIIARKLISERFDKNGYQVPIQLIEKMIDGIAADLAGGDRKLLEKKARKAGYSIQDLKKQAHMRAATMMLINARCYDNVYITPKQVYDYYEAHKGEYLIPRKLKLQMLYLKSTFDNGTGNIAQFAIKLKPKITKADETTFAEFVSRHSVGPNKNASGNVGWIGSDKLRPEFATALKDKPLGSVVGPVKTQEGFYFIRIAGLKESTDTAFYSVKANIKTKLEDEEKKKNYDTYIKKIKEGAIIRYFLTQ